MSYFKNIGAWYLYMQVADCDEGVRKQYLSPIAQGGVGSEKIALTYLEDNLAIPYQKA